MKGWQKTGIFFMSFGAICEVLAFVGNKLNNSGFQEARIEKDEWVAAQLIWDIVFYFGGVCLAIGVGMIMRHFFLKPKKAPFAE